MELVMVGSGNVATGLGHLLQQKGHPVLQVVSRNLEHARKLGEFLQVPFTNDFDQMVKDGELYILAVSDDALGGLNHHLRLGDSMVVHTSGGMPLSAINLVSSRTGVLYPLQTFQKSTSIESEIPFLLEGSDPDMMNKLWMMAESISGNVVAMDSVKRQKLHLAAVFGNNFLNHLLSLVRDFCQKYEVNDQLLLPIIEETWLRAGKNDPRLVQTGPSFRGDLETIRLHLEMLEPYPGLKEMYQTYSKNIFSFHHPGEELPQIFHESKSN